MQSERNRRRLGENTRRSLVVSDFLRALTAIESLLEAPIGTGGELLKFIRGLKRVLSQVREREPWEVLDAIEQGLSSITKDERKPDIDIESIKRLKPAEVRRAIEDIKTRRQEILEIAHHRFGASRGSLSRLSRQALVDEVAALLRNEESHDAIARLASSDPTQKL